MRMSQLYFVLFLASVVASALAVGAPANPGQPNLGANVIVFNPSMPVSQIQAAVNAVAAQQVDNEMGTQRYALLFLPGTYGDLANPLSFQVGYYTEVAGLGASPTDVVINGNIDVYNRCLTANNCVALDNFWRSLSNLTINVAGQSGCRSGTDFWAVSQAAPLRRVNIAAGNLSLMDYCSAGPQEASGGFIADTQTRYIINGSQQQFLIRDSSITGWSNGVWNQVFSGVLGAPAQSFPTPPYTTLPTSPVTRERPFLYADASGNYNVFVPALRTDSAGTTWANGPAAGSSIPIQKFLIATPSTPILQINLALLGGRSVLFTPGIYKLSAPVVISRPDTVVLGLGFPTLSPQNGLPAMVAADVPGIKIAGLLFDAGPVNSPVLLEVGTPYSHRSNSSDPISLHDVFFRIGGASTGKATTSLVVISNNVLLDNIWAWRADHGLPGTVGWTVNTADTGLIVAGNDVTAYGLFVEHFQKDQVIWNGENGRTIMFQNEMPYDPPNQAAWMHDGVLGYAAYKVGNNVQTHEGWGLGSYCFFNVDPTIHAAHGFEVPDVPNVRLHDILTISLGGNGVIDHVVNNTGAAAQGIATVPVDLVSYP